MKILSITEIAERLGLHPQTIKKHIYTTKVLEDLVQYLGRSPGFTEDQLPEIKRRLENSPQSGRGTATKAEAARRQQKAVALHAQGQSYSQIAAALGYNDASGAHKAVTRAMAKAAPKKKTKKR